MKLSFLTMGLALAAGAIGLPAIAQVDPLSAESDSTGLTVTNIDGRQAIRVDGKTTLRTTSNAIRNQRIVDVSGSPVRLALWEEILSDGQVAPFYSVSLGGDVFSRARQTDYTIHLRYAGFDPLAEGEPMVDAVLTAPAG